MCFYRWVYDCRHTDSNRLISGPFQAIQTTWSPADGFFPKPSFTPLITGLIMLIDPKSASPLLTTPLLTHDEFQALLHGIFPLSVLPFETNQSELASPLSDLKQAATPLNQPSAVSSSALGSVDSL